VSLIATAMNYVPGLRAAVNNLRRAPNGWEFVARGGPRRIFDPADAAGGFYSCVRIDDKPRSPIYQFELQLNVQYRGFSGELHELDVSLLTASTAKECRRTQTDPLGISARAAIETKCYSGATGIEIGRQALATRSDLNTTPYPARGPEIRGHRCSRCEHRTTSILVSPNGWTLSARGFANAWQLVISPNLALPTSVTATSGPVTLTAVERQFAARVASLLLDGGLFAIAESALLPRLP
jgi:hypothetical protein